MKTFYVFIFVGLCQCCLAQYNIADTNYINTAIKISKFNSVEAIEAIQKYHLNPNYVFAFPKDSLKNYSSTSKTSYSSSPSSPSYSYSSGSHNIGQAIGSLIAAPFIAIGRALSGLFGSRSSKSTSNNVVKVDSSVFLPRVIPVYQTSLVKEMLNAQCYGEYGKLYLTMIHEQPIETSILDTLFNNLSYVFSDRLIPLALYTEDTMVLHQYEQKKIFNINSNINVAYARLNKPLLVAVYFNNKMVLDYLLKRNVNPNVITSYGYHNVFDLGAGSGIVYHEDMSLFKDKFKTYKLLDVCSDKDLKKKLRVYIRKYNKNIKH